MTQPQGPAPEWTRVTRDFIRLVDVKVDGSPVDPADLSAALLPVGATPSTGTTWTPTVPHPEDGAPALRIAGPDADTTNAVVITGDSVVWGRVVADGTVLVSKLGRIAFRRR